MVPGYSHNRTLVLGSSQNYGLTVFWRYVSLLYEKCMCYMKGGFYTFLMCMFLDAGFRVSLC